MKKTYMLKYFISLFLYKVGANYNVFKNFNDLQNEIFVGLRYGNSKFDQQLNSFKIHNLDNYWNQNLVEQQSNYDNLSASWIEFVVGFKAQVINNLYMGLNLKVNRLISQVEPDNFNNLFIPGFNKVLEDSNIGEMVDEYGTRWSPIVRTYENDW